jgi:hypothetical protein
MIETSSNKSTVSFHVTNCSATEANFISGIVALFCDPNSRDLVEQIKSSKLAIIMDPTNGRPCLEPIALPNEAFSKN